eukprot:COSAG03_NODE_14849_length_450_cov_0.495726_1_plen_77_part_10
MDPELHEFACVYRKWYWRGLGCASRRRHLATGFESLAIRRGWRLLRQLPYNSQGKLTQSDFEAAAGPRPRQPAATPL